MEELTFEIAAVLFAVAAAGGFVDAIAGGGGLLTVPVLLWTGMTPAQALATNKLQACFGSSSAALYFVRKGEVSLRHMVRHILWTFIGAASGAICVQLIDASMLETIIPGLLIVIALYLLLNPRIGESDRCQRMGSGIFAFAFGLSIGFYDGFFGPGTGSFWAIAFVSLMGFNLVKATAHTKVLNFTSNFASLLFFIAGGQVVWAYGFAMAGGQFIGAQLGARTVLGAGGKVVRPLLVVMCVAMSVKLLWKQVAL